MDLSPLPADKPAGPGAFPADALILTLRLDPASFARLDAARRAHMPEGRYLVPAHLTLFHALPGARAAEILDDLATLAAATPALPLRIAGLRSLGKGVAYTVEGAGLGRLRALLAARWHEDLTPQDRQGFKPHVTVQNKVTAEAARATLARLADGFAPWDATGEGLDLWAYRGGPWEAVGAVAFRTPGAA